jgi:hypothetical protein
MKAQHRFWPKLVVPLSLAGMPGMSCAAELNPAAVAFKLPDQIPWSTPDARGVQTAVMAGDPAKPVFYVVLTKRLKGNHFSHRTSIPTTAISRHFPAPGGSARGRSSIRTT